MTNLTTFDNNFTIVRDAQVTVEADIIDDKTVAVATIGNGDQMLQHTFSPKSMVSQSIVLGADKVTAQLQGGTYFFKDESLVSYRNGNYNGFCHSDDGINQLLEHIGFTEEFDKAQHHSNSTDKIRLQNVHSNVEMQIDQYESGGEMNSQLSFAWDPFQAHIRAAFKLIRLICTNGMVGLADFMNCKIPIVNQWIEHMEIANAQIQNKITSMVSARMISMSNERASVRDCLRVNDACHARLNDTYTVQDDETIARIREIALVTDVKIHCADYPNRIHEDRRLSEQAASHLTEFTLWNMLTELASHTRESSKNSDVALYKHANELLIDRDDSRVKCVTNSKGNNQSKVSVKFEDLNAAFAGDLLEMS